MRCALESLQVAACGLLGTLWTALSASGRSLVGPERFDRLVERTGLRRLKARAWLERARLPDGTVLLHRPQDRCIIDEIRAGTYGTDALAPGGTVVDIGAHIGTFALTAGRRVGPRGRVLALEPSPASLELLRRNVEANAMGWVSVHPVAAAEAEAEAELFTASDRDNPAADTLSATPGRPRVTVRLRRLDDLLAEEGVGPIDLLKIDVEGAELRVLAGAPAALARSRRVVLEVHPPKAEVQDVRKVLEASGFSCRLLSTTPLIIEGVTPQLTELI
ncbi:MAG: FkbM family methyltransferase [Elusimicrobiota bacterium]|jgi:FkbM family methyltransferase